MKNRQLMRLNEVLHLGQLKTIDCISPGYVSFLEDIPKDNTFGKWVDLDEVEFIPITQKVIETLKEKSNWAVTQSMLHLFPSIEYFHQLQNAVSLQRTELTLK